MENQRRQYGEVRSLCREKENTFQDQRWPKGKGSRQTGLESLPEVQVAHSYSCLMCAENSVPPGEIREKGEISILPSSPTDFR